MKEQMKKNKLTSLAPLLIFAIFTFCILMVLLTGANVYQKFSRRDQDNFQRRTTAQYLTTRIRQNDVSGMIFVGSFDGTTPQTSGNTLFLCEELNGRLFYTRIYCHDGYLRELFAESGISFSPTAGQEILEVKDLFFTIQADLIYVDIDYVDTTTETLILHVRSVKEVTDEK